MKIAENQIQEPPISCGSEICLDKKVSKEYRDRAEQLRDEIRERLKKEVKGFYKDGKPIFYDRDITVAVLVVRKRDGSRELWVTANIGGRAAPSVIKDLLPEDAVWKRSPRRKNGSPKRQNHAEQRGLRAADADPDVVGVETIAPTRRCCNREPDGCSQAIAARGDPELSSVIAPPGQAKLRPEEPPLVE